MSTAAKLAALMTAVLLALTISPLGAQVSSTPAVAADEKALAAEKKPNFASPQVEDKTLKITGVPEPLSWFTSKPGIFGSTRAKQGGTYHGYLGEFPSTFRTVGPNSNHAYRPLFLTSPGLVELNNETMEWLPAMATHWAFGADKKTVYFKLNEKATWTDGKPVTSKDYLFLLQFMRSPNIDDPWSNEHYTEQIVDLRAYGPWVVSVHLDTVMDKNDLLYNATVSPRPEHFYKGAVPANYVETYNWQFEPTAGPYALVDFEKGESLTFKKVKNWWGYGYDYNKYRFNIETLEYRVITGGNDILRNYFLQGEVDQFHQIIPTEWVNGEKMEPIVKGWVDRQYFFYVPLTGASGIFLNTQFGPFSNVKVRQGLYYAFNMQKMIDTVLRGEYSRYHNIGLAHVFAGIEFDDNTIRKPDFDPKKAGELFDQAGYSQFDGDGVRKNAQGERLSFELLYASPNHTERLAVLKEEAKKAGVEVVMKLQQQGAFTALLEKKYQASWTGMSTSLVPDYWQYFHSTNAKDPQTNNFWGYANPEMDKLLDAFRDESNLAKKAELDKKIQRMVDQEALIIPNYYVPFWRLASWKWVRYPAWLGQQFDSSFEDPISGTSGYVGYLWIDETIRKEVLDMKKQNKSYQPRTYKIETYKAK